MPKEESFVVGLNRLLLEDAYPDVIGKNVLLRENLRLDGIREIKIAGLYDVVIEYMDDIAEDKKDGIKKSVWSTLHKNRNICEDFVSLTEVETQSFLLCCELDLASDADVSRVKAEILFKVQQYLSPPVNNYTLSEMLKRTKADGTTYTADEIFDGPALDCGFIDDDELVKAKLLTKIRLSDIINIIMDIEGVQSVRDILINPVGTEIPLKNKWVVDVALGKKRCSIIKNRDGILQAKYAGDPDGKKADEYYEQLTDAATTKAEKKVEEDFDIPLGTHRHSERYYSFRTISPCME